MVLIREIWICRVSDFNNECFKAWLGNGDAMSLIFRKILGPLVLGWAPNYIVVGAQLAAEEKRLGCIPAFESAGGERVVAQLRTGYARLNEYLHKVNVKESNKLSVWSSIICKPLSVVLPLI